MNLRRCDNKFSRCCRWQKVYHAHTHTHIIYLQILTNSQNCIHVEIVVPQKPQINCVECLCIWIKLYQNTSGTKWWRWEGKPERIAPLPKARESNDKFYWLETLHPVLQRNTLLRQPIIIRILLCLISCTWFIDIVSVCHNHVENVLEINFRRVDSIAPQTLHTFR